MARTIIRRLRRDRDWLIRITHTPAYASHPWEWHLKRLRGPGKLMHDPTSWCDPKSALMAARQKIDDLSGPKARRCPVRSNPSRWPTQLG